MRKVRFLFLLASLTLFVGANSFGGSTFVIKYISAENVYLNGGKADGLKVGDRLTVGCGVDCSCELEIVFVADHSASCKMLTQPCDLIAGDKAMLSYSVPADTVALPVISVDSALPPKTAPERALSSISYADQPIAHLSGSMFLQYYTIDDRNSSNLDFSQLTGRLSMKARHLFGQPLTLGIRTRGRYDQRQREFGEVPQKGWVNRVWELSLSYDDPRSRISFQAGRISPRRIGSAGYLDGALLETRVTENIRIGFFGGIEPKWAYADGVLSMNKTGAYVTVLRGEPGKAYLEQSIAGVGEYFAGTVSRELLISQGRIQTGNRWSLFHTIEFDINRSWRKDKTDKSLSLSSLYMVSYYRFSSAIRFGLSYDNRTNYWTLETRSLVDSIFDDRLRQGARAQLDLRLPLRVQTSYSFGFREREGDSDPTLTHSVYVNRSGLIRRTITASVQWSSFDGPFEQGRNYSAQVGDYLLPQVYASVSYGGYEYGLTTENVWRRNHRISLSTQVDFARRYSLSGSIEFDNGDDLKGTRFLTELGYRF